MEGGKDGKTEGRKKRAMFQQGKKKCIFSVYNLIMVSFYPQAEDNC